MIRNSHRLAEWQKEYLKRSRTDLFLNLGFFEAMYEEARALGVLPLDNPLDGIEAKINFARRINVPTAAPKNRPRPE